MFVAGKMFETVEEAKAWMESQTTLDERRAWTILVIAVPPEQPLARVKGFPKPDKVDLGWDNVERLTNLSKVGELGQALIDAEEKLK